MIGIGSAIMIYVLVMSLVIIFAGIFDTPSTKEEKELSELRYDDPAKEGRYRKFKEKYEFQERLRKEVEIEKGRD